MVEWIREEKGGGGGGRRREVRDMIPGMVLIDIGLDTRARIRDHGSLLNNPRTKSERADKPSTRRSYV